MKMITAVTNTGFARYVTIEVAGTLKANGGDIGGGSENLVICRKEIDDDISESNRTADGKQSSGQLLRTGRI